MHLTGGPRAAQGASAGIPRRPDETAPVPTTATTRPLLRLPALRAATGDAGKSTIYRWIQDGIWPAPIRLGPNVAAWLADEVDAVLRARTAGADDAAVRALVASLHAARRQPASAA